MKTLFRYAALLSAISLSIAAALGPALSSAEESDAPDPSHTFFGTSVTHTSATVVGIEPTVNGVTLRRASGEFVNVDVNPNVGDVRRLALGDKLDITYTRALLLRAEKIGSEGIRSRVDTETTTPAVKGATTTIHRVQVVATVVSVDPANQELVLRGPTRTVILQMSSGVLLENLKAGDDVRAEYVESTAVQVTRDGAALQ